jgi:hypothetical protein
VFSKPEAIAIAEKGAAIRRRIAAMEAEIVRMHDEADEFSIAASKIEFGR